MTEQRVLRLTKGLDLGGLERVVIDLVPALPGQGVPFEVAVINDCGQGALRIPPRLTPESR